jgi:hypothetical protein
VQSLLYNKIHCTVSGEPEKQSRHHRCSPSGPRGPWRTPLQVTSK